MKKTVIIYLFIFSIIACKSEFETIRTSNDPTLIFQKALDYYEKEDWIKAQALLELSIPNYRGKVEAEDLFFKYADTYYQNGEFILAAHYFKNFATTFYNSDRKEEAEFLSAYSNYQMSPNPKLDQTYTYEAIEGFQRFVNTHPESDRVGQCNDLIDEMRKKLEIKAFQQGELYYNIGQYQSAVSSFSNLLKDFPESDQAERVRFLMLKSSFELADKSIYSKKKERFEDTVTLYETFKRKHPKSDFTRDVNDIYKKTQSELNKLKA